MGEGAATDRAAHPLAEEAERVAATLSGKLADAPATSPESSPGNRGRARVPEEGATRPADVAPETTRAATTAAATLHEAAPDDGDARAGERAAERSGEARGGVRGRAAAVGASVGESLRPRVERLREASSVVIDEAAEDPGVRFLVVAAALFLLFLLLWLLSFTLG